MSLLTVGANNVGVGGMCRSTDVNVDANKYYCQGCYQTPTQIELIGIPRLGSAEWKL